MLLSLSQTTTTAHHWMTHPTPHVKKNPQQTCPILSVHWIVASSSCCVCAVGCMLAVGAVSIAWPALAATSSCMSSDSSSCVRRSSRLLCVDTKEKYKRYINWFCQIIKYAIDGGVDVHLLHIEWHVQPLTSTDPHKGHVHCRVQSNQSTVSTACFQLCQKLECRDFVPSVFISELTETTIIITQIYDTKWPRLWSHSHQIDSCNYTLTSETLCHRKECQLDCCIAQLPATVSVLFQQSETCRWWQHADNHSLVTSHHRHHNPHSRPPPHWFLYNNSQWHFHVLSVITALLIISLIPAQQLTMTLPCSVCHHCTAHHLLLDKVPVYYINSPTNFVSS